MAQDFYALVHGAVVLSNMHHLELYTAVKYLRRHDCNYIHDSRYFLKTKALAYHSTFGFSWYIAKRLSILDSGRWIKIKLITYNLNKWESLFKEIF